jgi:hypothetical protein
MRVLDEELKSKNAEMGSVTTGTASEDPTAFSSSIESLSKKIEQKYRSNKRMFLFSGIILLAGMIALSVGVGMSISNGEQKEKNPAVVIENDERRTNAPSTSPTMGPTLNPGSWDLEFLDMETKFGGNGFGNNRGQIRLQYLAHLRDVQVYVFQNDCIKALPDPRDVAITTEMDPDSNKSKGILSVFFNVKRDSSVWVDAADNRSGTVNFCVRTELVVVDDTGEAFGVNFKETVLSIKVQMSNTGVFVVDVPIGN